MEVTGDNNEPCPHLLPRTHKDNTGKPTPIYNENCVPPTLLQLYKRIPQSKKTSYKGEATFYDVLSVLAEEGWLEKHEDDTTDAKCILSIMNP